MYKTRVSSKGQLVFPAELRREDGVGEGVDFAVERVPEGYLLIRLPKNPVHALRGLTKGLGISSKDIKRMRLEDEKKRAKKLGV